MILSKIEARSTADHQNGIKCARFMSKTLEISAQSTEKPP